MIKNSIFREPKLTDMALTGNVKFGVSQRRNPTPNTVSIGIDIFIGVSGIVGAYVISVPYIPHSVSDIVSSVLGLLCSIAVFIRPYFGVKVNTDTVPTQDVETIDNTTGDK